MRLNSPTSIGEDIADNGGIILAYNAYQWWKLIHGEEPLLPGLNYTQN